MPQLLLKGECSMRHGCFNPRDLWIKDAGSLTTQKSGKDTTGERKVEGRKKAKRERGEQTMTTTIRRYSLPRETKEILFQQR